MQLEMRARARASWDLTGGWYSDVGIIAKPSPEPALGGRNSNLAQSPLQALDNGERIFILADQGDADVRIFAAHVSPNRADRVAIDDRDHARPLVLPQ
jgi:hypothetical protein